MLSFLMCTTQARFKFYMQYSIFHLPILLQIVQNMSQPICESLYQQQSESRVKPNRRAKYIAPFNKQKRLFPYSQRVCHRSSPLLRTPSPILEVVGCRLTNQYVVSENRRNHHHPPSLNVVYYITIVVTTIQLQKATPISLRRNCQLMKCIIT